MFSKLFTVVLLASSLFSPLAEAGRFREVAHRKGFSPNFKPRHYQEPAKKLDERGSKYRFLTNATESK
jgi:hypothetical protein